MEPARPNHYRVLQVDPAANHLVIQAAYRVLAQIWHPDVAGDEAEMKRINAAWEVLGDPQRREQYDIERAARQPSVQVARAPGPAAPANDPASGTANTARPAASAPAPRPEDHAGPPRGVPFGPVVNFGRYEGWTLGQIARIDRPFLEWLRRAPAGRAMRDEIDSVFRSAGIQGVDRRAYDLDRQRAQGAPVGARRRD